MAARADLHGARLLADGADGGGNFGAGGTFGAAGLAGSIFLDPQHWTGGGSDSLASNGQNWSGGAAPLGGGRLVFGASETAKAAIWNLGVIPSSASLLPSFSTSVVLVSSWTIAGEFAMAGGTVASAAGGLVLRLDGSVAQTGGRVNMAGSTIAVAGAGGDLSVHLANAAALRLVVGGAGASTASVSGSISVSSRAHVGDGAVLYLTTGTLAFAGDGPYTGGGHVVASTGHWTVANGPSAQTWTRFNGNFGSLRVSNTGAGVLSLSTAAGSSFSLTGGLTVDLAAVLRATGAALGVAGNWSVPGSFLAPGSTVTFTGGGASTIAVTAGASFDYLLIDSTSPVTVTLSTTVTVASTITVAAGTLNLAGSTISVRGTWLQTGGTVLGATSRTIMDGVAGQTVVQLPGSTFGAFVSSSTGGLTVAGPLTATAQFEWRRGALNISSRAISVGGDMSTVGGAGLTFGGSTVTLSGVSTQTINFPFLDHVIVDNPNPVRLGQDSTWGTFTINPGRFFDGVSRSLTITGDRWTSAGATYTSVPQQHAVTWNPPATITVGAGSIVNARLALGIGKTAQLQGGLFVDGPGNALEPRQGSTIVNAPGGSTITFRVSSDLSPVAGPNWFYAGDVQNSWLVFQGTGGARGAFVSTITLGSVQVALSTNSSIFQPPDLNLLGSLVISTGVVRPLGSRTITLGGDLLQTGGLLDFNTASTGTIRFVGGSTSTISLLPGATIWNLVADGTGTLQAASFLRVRGDFAANAGVFRAGASSHSFQTGFVVGPGGFFDGETSTVTFDGAALGRINQNVTFLGGGQFWGSTRPSRA
ncbi:MAG: hypothetical protein M0D55_04920 [Elusimicrobiota bacterium]|nr:MAG: hypothetical protein M0D55_04920 [Elusimicrobiota bacterium]